MQSRVLPVTESILIPQNQGVLRHSPPRRRALGQHHLRTSRLAAPLLRFLDPKDRILVEIGAGGGVLTRALLHAGARQVLALELDPPWAVELLRRLRDPRLTLVVGDALRLRWDRLPVGVAVCGNLPYAIGTALVLELCSRVREPFRAAFLLQREVAERLAARPGTRAYGALSVLVQLRAQVHLLGRLRPEDFRPPPKVESAFVGLEVGAWRWESQQWRQLTQAVRAAFAHPRKTLRNSLIHVWGPERGEAIWARLGLSKDVRPGNLPPETFLNLLEVDKGLAVERVDSGEPLPGI